LNWTGKRVLVTGAGGFIGSHLAERLVEEGARVRALVHYNALDSWGWLDESARRAEMEVVAGDVRDRDSVQAAVEGAEIVFHLAALIAIPYSYHAPASYVETNVLGTLNLLQAARRAGVERLVQTSTSEVYGTAQYAPIDEKHPQVGQSPYSASKIGADKLAESFHLSFSLPVVILRPFNTFGPRQSARAVVPTIITQALSGGPVKLGNLAPTRDLTFVRDTVAGFLAAAAATEAVGLTLNLGTGRDVSIGELARLILARCGSGAEIVTEEQRVRPADSEVERLVADNSLARKVLSWEPRVSLEEGLASTIDWLSRHLEKYRPHAYTL